jgi:hypothetical protein
MSAVSAEPRLQPVRRCGVNPRYCQQKGAADCSSERLDGVGHDHRVVRAGNASAVSRRPNRAGNSRRGRGGAQRQRAADDDGILATPAADRRSPRRSRPDMSLDILDLFLDK